MRLLIVAVGQRVPDWAQTAWDDYVKRFPSSEFKLELKAVKTEARGSKTLEQLYAAERVRIEAAIPKGTRIVALDERGTNLTTVALAGKLKSWQARMWGERQHSARQKRAQSGAGSPCGAVADHQSWAVLLFVG